MDEVDQLEFELDFCICCNMMLGMSYEEARRQALEDMKAVREEN